jgi:hypothetical protein
MIPLRSVSLEGKHYTLTATGVYKFRRRPNNSELQNVRYVNI